MAISVASTVWLGSNLNIWNVGFRGGRKTAEYAEQNPQSRDENQ